MRTIHLVRCSWHPAGCETRRTPNLRWSRVGLLRCYRRRARCSPRRCPSVAASTSHDCLPARYIAVLRQVAHGWYLSCCLRECHALVDVTGPPDISLAVVGHFGDSAVPAGIPYLAAIHAFGLAWHAQRGTQGVQADAVAGAGPLRHGVEHHVGVPWAGVVRPPDRWLHAEDDGAMPDETQIEAGVVMPDDARPGHVVAPEVNIHQDERLAQDGGLVPHVVAATQGERRRVIEGQPEHGELPAPAVERGFAPGGLGHFSRLLLAETRLPLGDHRILGGVFDLAGVRHSEIVGGLLLGERGGSFEVGESIDN